MHRLKPFLADVEVGLDAVAIADQRVAEGLTRGIVHSQQVVVGEVLIVGVEQFNVDVEDRLVKGVARQ